MTISADSAPHTPEPSVTYQGQFGEFTITAADRRGVVIYRAGLMVAAVSFALGTALALFLPTLSLPTLSFPGWENHPSIALSLISWLYSSFTIALGISLLTIHIYMVALHRALQLFWVIGTIAALIVAHIDPQPLAVTVYQQPLTLLGIGFTFVALTGIFFKEAFCFNRLETKLLTPIVPGLLLGHLIGVLPIGWERGMLGVWAALFLVFAGRKAFQAMPDDIGDKSVFEYLKHRK